jgi:MerR family transcriptional regulator, repressor of the yfmOP operon
VSLTPTAGETQSDAQPQLRIQEVADQVGLTTRSIRYYEEIGLLNPARSGGSYRLYDADDVARLQFIKGLRDDAGFSLAEIGQLLEDENARAQTRARFRATTDAGERRALLREGIDRIDRQVATLRAKIDRIQAMIDAASGRRAHLEDHLAELEPGSRVRAHETPR